MNEGGRADLSGRPWRAAAAFLVAALPVGSGGPKSHAGFALRDGDRVVFYGDSITEARHYPSFVETYVLTRFPKLSVTFVSSGWSGDTVRGGDGGPIEVRLARDVLAYEPTVLTVMLGMNDGRVRPFDPQAFDAYTTGYRRIVDTVKGRRPGVRITLLHPSPYDDVTRPPDFAGGYNDVLVRYGAFVRELAASHALEVADLNAPVVKVLSRAHAADPAAARRLIRDRIHPGPQVTLVMAQALLQAWGAPSLVTEVAIDVSRKVAGAQVRTRVTDLRVATDGVSWTQTDQALPMPLDTGDPLVRLVLRAGDFVAALNRQPLKVTGLGPGHWHLRIDGQAVGTFGSGSLAAGINLAELPTPMVRQAAEVHELTNQRNAVHWTRWREVQVPIGAALSATVREKLRALDAREAGLVQRQRAAAQPRARRYELRPEPEAAAVPR